MSPVPLLEAVFSVNGFKLCENLQDVNKYVRVKKLYPSYLEKYGLKKLQTVSYVRHGHNHVVVFLNT